MLAIFQHGESSYSRRMRPAFIPFILIAGSALAQAPLQQQIRTIAAEAHGKVSVACSLPGTPLDCDLNPNAHPPMQSVFKLPLVITILHQVEQSKFTLDQPVRFLPSDRFPKGTWSPLQDKYPAADVDVPLRSLLQLTVSQSDNAASEVLLRTAGGPAAVTAYIRSLGVEGFQLQDGELAMQGDQRLQYRNWLAPRSAVALLQRISDRSPLTEEHTQFLLGCMRGALRLGRLDRDLPEGTIVAHKTGSSGTEKGLAAATNDIGLVSLPDGRQLAIAVFVTDSTADDVTRDKVIARIAKVAYDAALREPAQHSSSR